MLAARRSGLPLAKCKISSSRLPIGVTSDCELADLFLESYVPATEAARLVAR